ncbi:hypothetical protein N7533_010080 [Penicillium manginii]|uniref:uncharacterized protein n=1 Tax=Penicillium manginii TaxID=203109 RepID=UPI0025469C9B|nr:uncharacterized protein N7533_010080 [Penicillium manginii]KAJ5742978.1 hypothetical protein N7533_010080 [Penicillium manginii]
MGPEAISFYAPSILSKQDNRTRTWDILCIHVHGCAIIALWYKAEVPDSALLHTMVPPMLDSGARILETHIV